MKEILLYYPIATSLFQSVPYSLLYIERMIRDYNVVVKIFDQKHDGDCADYVKSNKDKIILVGISVMYSYQTINARKLAEEIKSFSNIPILFGGWFPTFEPEIVLKEKFVDYIIIGQGEIPFKKLIEKILISNNNFNEIKGLGYKSNGNLIINKDIEWTNIFEFSRINMDKTDMSRYLEHEGTTIQYLATTGCNCNCNFCILSSIKGSKHYTNKLENIVEDIKELQQKYPKLKYIKFNDDNLFNNKDFVVELSNKIISEGLNFNWCASSNISILDKKYTDSDLQIIKKAGCDLIYMGAESADNTILKKINKNYTKETIIKILRFLKRHNIKASFSFMVAFPPNPYKDFTTTIKHIMKLFRINKNLDVTIKIYLPIMPNEFRDEAINLDFKIPDSYLEYEEKVANGFDMKWIDDKLRNTLFYFTDFYIPIYKKEVPINSPNETYKAWKVFFAVFYPFVWLRFALNVHKCNWDAWLGLKIINRIKNRTMPEQMETELNNFMIGSTRIEK